MGCCEEEDGRCCICHCLCFLYLSLSLCCEEEVDVLWRGGCAVLYSAAPPARAIRPYGAGPSSLLIIDWGERTQHIPALWPPPPLQDLGLATSSCHSNV